MWKVVLLACVANLIVSTHHQVAQPSAYSFAASSSRASSCGGACKAKPKLCNNPNERFDPCPAPCPPCAPGPRPGGRAGRPACRCIDGYVRNEKNRCILRDNCPKPGCNGDPNATPGCGINCGRTCAAINSSEQQFCIQQCKQDGCDCNQGFVLDERQGKCVLPKDCSKPGCNGDPNASPGCGVNCGRTCSTYNSPDPVACILVCYENGCDCNEGYVFDDSQKRCVLPGDCTPQCGLNEVLSTCSNGGCGPFTCSDLGRPMKCVRPRTCRKGCVCQNTYVRSENGTCIPKDQCIAPKCYSMCVRNG